MLFNTSTGKTDRAMPTVARKCQSSYTEARNTTNWCVAGFCRLALVGHHACHADICTVAKCVNISKTVRDRSKVTVNEY